MFLYSLIGLTFLEFEFQSGTHSTLQYGIGALLLLVGFGLAFAITFDMGWRNAFGEKRELRKTGWFSWSRNPIYVVTWVGLIGWGLIANSVYVSILLLMWAVSYFLAPMCEEKWLESRYGEDYLEYESRTPRFF